MLMGEALLARLKAATGVTALAGQRIFWRVRPQSGASADLPAVVLTVVDEDRPQHLDGFEDMKTSRVQASCLAMKYGAARELAEAVIAAAVPEAEAGDGTVLFWRGSVDSVRDLGDQTDQGFVHHVAVDLVLRWARVVPA